MPPPTTKKARLTTANVDGFALGPITNKNSFIIESDSDELQLEDPELTSESEEESGNAGLSESNSDEEAIPNAPLSPPPTVAKRKRGRKAKQIENADATVAEPAPTVKLTYILSILSADEATKPVSKRMPISASLELGAEEPWDTIKVQLLVKISEALTPQALNFDDYLIMFFIPRVLPKPGMALSTNEHYTALLLRAKNLVSKTPTINLTIQQKKGDVDKENVAKLPNAEATDGGKSKKKKEPVILPGNVNRAAKVLLLQERWKCVIRQPGTCVGAYCYVFPDTGIHHPLNHERLECWASAMLKNDDSSTVEKPPNHRLFDRQTTLVSPVLARRAEAQNTVKVAAASAAPVFNISVGDGVLDLFRPARAAAQAPEPPAPQMLAGFTNVTKMLLNPSCDTGADMPIAEFCNTFGLQHTVLEKLVENAYDFARNLRFITLENLTEMGFKLGEKAALQDAVERWSVPRIM